MSELKSGYQVTLVFEATVIMDAFREHDTQLVTVFRTADKPSVRSLPECILEKDTKPIFGHYLCSFGYKCLMDLIALNGNSK